MLQHIFFCITKVDLDSFSPVQSHQKPEMTFLDIRLGSLSLERM